jgi:hypothetical protein
LGPDESELLIAFARAASKAQEIEALLQEIDIAAEVATDTKNRSFEEIAAEIEKLPLGPLKEKFLKVAQITDPLFPKMWKEINEERIFLMHKFFKVFPLPLNADGLLRPDPTLRREKVLRQAAQDPRSDDSSSIKAVSFSSAWTTKRFPSSRCASAIQNVHPLSSSAEIQPTLATQESAFVASSACL